MQCVVSIESASYLHRSRSLPSFCVCFVKQQKLDYGEEDSTEKPICFPFCLFQPYCALVLAALIPLRSMGNICVIHHLYAIYYHLYAICYHATNDPTLGNAHTSYFPAVIIATTLSAIGNTSKRRQHELFLSIRQKVLYVCVRTETRRLYQLLHQTQTDTIISS